MEVLAAEGKANKFRPDRILIQPKHGAAAEGLKTLHSRFARRTLKKFDAIGGLQVVELGAGEDVAGTLAALRGSGLVAFAEPDYQLRASVLPNDPHFSSGFQWSLRNSTTGRDIHATAAWDVANSASNIIVAVVDSGIRYTHEDLAANMWRNPGEIPGNGIDDDRNGIRDDVHGINAVSGTGDPMDDGDHGTHVAGIIGAVGNNGRGIAGVAWNVKLMACKFLDIDGVGYTSDAIEGIDYARRMGAHVINASFGGEDYSSSLFSAIQSARSAGVIFVTAAGNEQMNIDTLPVYPACYSLDNIIVVGGSTRSDTFDSGYSNFGIGNVDLFAPGTGIYSTWGSSDTAYISNTGTSMATPHVSGAVALMRARFTNLTSGQIVTRLLGSVDPLPALSGRCKTGGRLNLAKALGPDPSANFSSSVLIGEPPLNVAFTNISLGELRSVSWDFGDGSEPVSSDRPAHVFARTGDFNVRLTVIGTNGNTDSIQQTVRVMANYQYTAIPYAWVEPTGMTRITLTDNGVSPAQSLPFEFSFYGVPRSNLYIGANGIVGFTPEGLGNIDNVTLPNTSAPNAVIAPFWDNLDPASAGTVYAGTTGTAPNRRFVVSWVNVPRVANAAYLSFQVILEEGTGEMVFNFREVEGTRGGGRSATIGIENSAGDTAALYSHNGSPHLLQNRSALRVGRKVFRYLVVNRRRLSFDAIQGSGSASNVVISLENAGNTNLNWSVGSTSSWLAASTVSGALAGGEVTQVQIQLTPEAGTMSPGSYETALNISNLSDGGGDVTLPVTLRIQPGGSILEFTPATADSFSGGLGGPFEPSSLSIQLRNGGSSPLDWAGSSDALWVALDPSSGHLAPGEVTTVLIAPSTNANSLAAGAHTAALEFRNIGASGATPFRQSVRLQVNERLESSSASVLNGRFRAELAAPQSGTYAVEYSVDLETWETLTTSAAVNGSVVFDDPISPGGNRFYRLRLL